MATRTHWLPIPSLVTWALLTVGSFTVGIASLIYYWVWRNDGPEIYPPRISMIMLGISVGWLLVAAIAFVKNI